MTTATRNFTGWHMTAILVAFFGVVIGVNLVMARFAISTFGGTVVDNSYVASQNFNGWIDRARAGDRLGWRIGHDVGADGRLLVSVTDAAGQPVSDATVSARLVHPLGRAAETRLDFAGQGAGRYHSRTAMPAGRWQVGLVVRRGDDSQALAFDRP